MTEKDAKTYLSTQEIPQLFESLITGLLCQRPEDHITFLQDCLLKVKDDGIDGISGRDRWTQFMEQIEHRKKSPLPPINDRTQTKTPDDQEDMHIQIEQLKKENECLALNNVCLDKQLRMKTAENDRLRFEFEDDMQKNRLLTQQGLCDVEEQLSARKERCNILTAALQREAFQISRLKEDLQKSEEKVVSFTSQIGKLTSQSGTLKQEICTLQQKEMQSVTTTLAKALQDMYIGDDQRTSARRSHKTGAKKIPDNLREMCRTLAHKLGKMWRSFGRVLKLSGEELDDLQEQYEEFGSPELVWCLLEKWFCDLDDPSTEQAKEKLTEVVTSIGIKIDEMDKGHMAQLNEARTVIMKDLCSITEVLFSLETKKMVTKEMKDQILYNKTRSHKISHLLDILPTLGPRALSSFVHALNETGQNHLAELFEIAKKEEYPSQTIDISHATETVAAKADKLIIEIGNNLLKQMNMSVSQIDEIFNQAHENLIDSSL